MTTQKFTIEELKSVKLNSNQDLVVRHQNYVRKITGKQSDLNDQTDFPKSKKRAIEIAKKCEETGLDYSIEVRTF